MIMKLYLKLTVAGLVMTLAVTGTRAAQTNLVQVMSIVASAYAQGPIVTNGNVVSATTPLLKFATPAVIQALGASVGSNFSSTAKLLMVTPLLPSDVAGIFVQDGTNRTDVTGFFLIQETTDTMRRFVLDLNTGKAAAVSYDVERLRLRDQGGFPNLTMHLDIRGFTTVTAKTVVNGGGTVIGEAPQVSAIAAGDGDWNQTNLVVKAAIKIVGATLEVK
jgi:hypothetical protein